jgi:hypothetical protein
VWNYHTLAYYFSLPDCYLTRAATNSPPVNTLLLSAN